MHPPFTSDTARDAGAKGNATQATKRPRAPLFTSETARELGRKGGLKRAANAAAKRAAELEDQKALTRLREAFKRQDLGKDALITAHDVIARVQAGEIPIRNGTEAANF